MNIGLIPARGGSKTIPRKNIKLLNGKPLITYTIEAALNSRLLDKVIVSTDDEEIKQVALQYGAEVPFLRPQDISDDKTGDLPVVLHAMEWSETNYRVKVDNIAYLRPTTPFKTGEIIDKCLEKANKHIYSGLRTVTQAEGVYHPYWMYKNENDILKPFVQGKSADKYYQRQLLPQCFRLNGVVDIMFPRTLRKNSLYGSKIGFVELPDYNSIDIDTEMDFNYCEFLMSNGKG